MPPIGFSLLSLILLAGTLLLSGCGQEPEPPAPTSPLGAVPAEPQRPGNPQAGYDALVNNAYVTCGIPYSAYLKTARPAASEQQIPGRRSHNAELPYSLTFHVADSGVELVTSNCLGCHAGHFNGELIIGLGNETLDFTRDPVVAVESAGAYVTGEKEAAEWRKWADRINAIAPYLVTDTIGVNPANNLTLALLAHRDPKTLAWSAEPLLAPPARPLPVSVPPWWRVGKKHALFYNTEGRGDHARFMMLIATTCTDTVAEARRIDAYFSDIRAYLTALEPPKYPFPIDRELAQEGRGIFEATCSRCHGTYGEQWSYPNLVIGTDEVGTDPELARAATGEAERFVRWYNRSFYGEISRAAAAPGYIAPPLDGVWATAPYLHNGSVPTIETLLNSSKRPRFWMRRSFDSKDYDQQALGWNFTVASDGKAGAADPEQRKRIYDTTLPGYSNGGHTFGDGLTDGQRRAVLEYLKTL